MLAPFVLRTNSVMKGVCIVSFVIIFSLGYLCGGLAAALLFGLMLAARRGDPEKASSTRYMRAEKRT
jgi:hypothetical protein